MGAVGQTGRHALGGDDDLDREGTRDGRSGLSSGHWRAARLRLGLGLGSCEPRSCEYGHFRPGLSLRNVTVPSSSSISSVHVPHPTQMMGPPYPYPSRPTRLSCSSTATHSNASDPSRRNIHRKENQFIYRNGSKLHAYDREKAPYPSSFDRDIVELYVSSTTTVLSVR